MEKRVATVSLEESTVGKMTLEALCAAAEGGQASAFHELGRALEIGLMGRARDKAAAVDMYHTGISRGCAWCLFRLAGCYLRGGGVEINRQRAMCLLRAAASKGVSEAEVRLRCLGDSMLVDGDGGGDGESEGDGEDDYTSCDRNILPEFERVALPPNYDGDGITAETHHNGHQHLDVCAIEWLKQDLVAAAESRSGSEWDL